MSDLITRLRSRLWQNSGDVNHWKLRDKAADALEAQRGTIEAQTELLRLCREERDEIAEKFYAQKAEVERLRGALKRLVASLDAHSTLHADDGDDVARMLEWAAAEDAARAALKETP